MLFNHVSFDALSIFSSWPVGRYLSLAVGGSAAQLGPLLSHIFPGVPRPYSASRLSTPVRYFGSGSGPGSQKFFLSWHPSRALHTIIQSSSRTITLVEKGTTSISPISSLCQLICFASLVVCSPRRPITFGLRLNRVSDPLIRRARVRVGMCR